MMLHTVINAYLMAGASANAAATLSPYYKHDSVVLSNGNLTAAQSGSAQYMSVACIEADPAKKLYCEVTIDHVGDSTAETGVAVGNYIAPLGGDYLGHNNNSVLCHRDGRVLYNNTNQGGGPGSYTTGDIIGVRIDGPAGVVYFNKNGGTWSSGYTPAGGGPLFLLLQMYHSSTQLTVNFGATGFTYSVPSGYETYWPPRSRGKRYFRSYHIANYNTQASIAEIELRLTASGADQTGSGTASASSVFSSPTYTADKAVDNNTGTIWHCSNNAGAGSWWQYDFGSGVTKDIREVLMTMRNDTLNYPSQFRFLDSDDGAAFFPLYGRYGLTWTQGEAKTFTFS